MKYVKTFSSLTAMLAVFVYVSSSMIASAGSNFIPIDWAMEVDTIPLYDADYPKTVCPKCRAKAESVVRKAERLRRYLEAIVERSDDFPNNMHGVEQSRRDLDEFKKELRQKLASLAAVKKQFKALMADIKQIQLDTDHLVGMPYQTETTQSGVATQVVNTGRYFIETGLRITEYFVNGKTANGLTKDKNGDASFDNVRKNIKDVNSFTALSKNGQALKLYAKAMRLEKAIRQLQDLIKIARENTVTPAELHQLDSLYAAFQQALAEQALCEEEYKKQCKKHDDSTIGSTGSTIDWSEFGLVDRSAINIKDLIDEPMPGLIPDDYTDPLDSTSGLMSDDLTIQKPVKPDIGNNDGAETLASGNGTSMMPSPSSGFKPLKPTSTEDLMPLPEGYTREEYNALLASLVNRPRTKFRAVCETVPQMCERYRDGPARKKCLASKDLANEVLTCRAEQVGKTCTTRCNSIANRIRAGEVLRRLSLDEIRKQLPFATLIMNLRLYAQEAKILDVKKQLEEIMQQANTPQLILYQNPKSLELLVADPADIEMGSEFVPIAPMVLSPVGGGLERQKALTVDLDIAQGDLKSLAKEARGLEKRIKSMLSLWRLNNTNADCTAANAGKMRQDCQIECEAGPPDNLFQLTEGLMSYTSCYSHKIELPLVDGVKNFFRYQIYLDAANE